MVPSSSASSSVRPLHTARHLPLPNVRALSHTFRYLRGILSEQYRSHRSSSVLQAFSQVANRQAARAFARPSLCSAWHCCLVLGGATKAPHMSCHTSAPSFTALSHRPCDARSGSGSSAASAPGRGTNNSVDVTSAVLSMACPPPLAYMERTYGSGRGVRIRAPYHGTCVPVRLPGYPLTTRELEIFTARGGAGARPREHGPGRAGPRDPPCRDRQRRPGAPHPRRPRRESPCPDVGAQ
jgi:hypothetical protein